MTYPVICCLRVDGKDGLQAPAFAEVGEHVGLGPWLVIRKRLHCTHKVITKQFQQIGKCQDRFLSMYHGSSSVVT